jgi:dTMP kinase
MNQIDHLNRLATGGLEPDITFLMDLSAQEAISRMRERYAESDRLEDEGLSFMEKVREGYIALSKKHSRIVRLDAEEPIQMVSEQIKQKVLEVLNK